MNTQRKSARFAASWPWFCALQVWRVRKTAEKKTLTLQGAERVIAAAKAEAQKLQAPGGVIAVVDDGGNLMALERLDGTFSAGANISIGKAKTAVMFKKPTRFFEELINSSGKGRTVMTALENFTPLIGGIPIIVDGQIVGGVGVSGAASADQDEQLAIAGSKAFDTGATSMSGDPAPAVSYWEKSKVDEAFSKGAVLFDGSDGRNYMVHASRREKPGQAEIHTKDADVIYVLQGSATFVTGGEAVDAQDHCTRRIPRQQHPQWGDTENRQRRRRHRAPRCAAPVSGSDQSVPLLRCEGSLSER